MILAITGGTGFVGKRLIDAALAAGHHIRALTRRPRPARNCVEWIEGDLADPSALATGADAIIHVAGTVNAPTRAAFAAGNVDGTAAILAAARDAGVTRFVHVSSLSAREPQLSDYGWSKAEAEALVEASDRDWVMVRPPAIYGPGDMDLRDVFRMARRGLALLPPPGFLSALHADDLSRLLLALATHATPRTIYEADDGTEGWTHDAFARAIGDAVGQRVLPFALPRALLSLAARGDRLVRGDKARLTPDRVSYMCHSDWRIDPARRPPADLWTPAIPTPQGLADTARWYRAHGLL